MTALFSIHIQTPLGPMLAIASESHLYLLEFIERRKLDRQLHKLTTKTNLSVKEEKRPIHKHIQEELTAYFEGKLTQFTTPIAPLGSPFQLQVWQILQTIPYGKTISYRDLAKALNKPTAFRAVAQANSHNPVAIIVPCHRVIYANGKLGGYAGGLEKKACLLHTESKLATDAQDDYFSYPTR